MFFGGIIMDFVLLHRWMGMPSNMPEVSKATLELAKKRKELCPQAKEIVSYWSMFGQTANAFCIWEAPNIEALQPLLSQFMNIGLTTS